MAPVGSPLRVFVSEYLPLLRTIAYPRLDAVPALSAESAFGEETVCAARAGGLCVHSDWRYVSALRRTYAAHIRTATYVPAQRCRRREQTSPTCLSSAGP